MNACKHGVDVFDSKGCWNCLVEENQRLKKESERVDWMLLNMRYLVYRPQDNPESPFGYLWLRDREELDKMMVVKGNK